MLKKGAVLVLQDIKRKKRRIHGGNSGAPFYNTNGELAGIVRVIHEIKVNKEGTIYDPCNIIDPTSIRSFLEDYITSVKDN